MGRFEQHMENSMEVLNWDYLLVIAALPLFIWVWWKWGRRSHTLKNTQVSRVRVSTKLGATLTFLIWASKSTLWIALVLGLAQAYFPFNQLGTEAAGVIHLGVDTSGSTRTGGVHYEYENWLAYYFDKRTDPAYVPPSDKPEDQKRDAQPIDTELGAARVFIEKSLGLRVGVSIFDDKVFYVYPATKDSQVAIGVLPQIRRYVDVYNTGTNFDGPAPGRPLNGGLQGALNLFSKEDGNAVRIYILVTDGMAPIDDARMKELVDAYKELKINFFVFGVDRPWEDLNNSSLKPILDFTKAVNGTAVRVQDKAAFEAAVEKIGDLARASVRTVYIKERHDALLLLLTIALVAAAMWLGLSALRRSDL